MSDPVWLVWQMEGKTPDVRRGIQDAATWHQATRGERPTAVLLNPDHEALGETITVGDQPLTITYRPYIQTHDVYVARASEA